MREPKNDMAAEAGRERVQTLPSRRRPGIDTERRRAFEVRTSGSRNAAGSSPKGTLSGSGGFPPNLTTDFADSHGSE
jgi:hypothetical protein